MNILKSSELINKSEYQKIYYHLNFDNILKSIFSGIKQYRFFEIKFKDESHISFKPKNDYFHLSNISKLSGLLNEESRSILMIMNEEKTFNIKEKKKILCYLHMDWMLAFQSLKEEDITNNELIQYLQFETGDCDIIKKIRHINGTSKVRSNIYTMNKDSVIVDIRDPSQSKNVNELTKKNYNLILKNPLISLIEISQGFDNHKLTEFLQVMNGFSKKVLSVQKVTEEMRFNLKIRKIKRTNKKGMYIVNQNTILLDPRYVDSFSHELGHWYHTWFHKEIKTEKEAENFAIQFEYII